MMEVLRAGLLDLVMDLGRPGYRAQGVPEGGAADAPALMRANLLVGNPVGAAGLELLLRGPQLRFSRGAWVALAGADMEARLEGEPLAPDRAWEIPPGAVLELGQAALGLRAFLAVAGGVEVPKVLGSRSTFLPGAFGGWQGRALKSGDVLPLGSLVAHRGGAGFPARPQGPLRIVPGPQLSGFADEALHVLSEGEYGVTTDSNRLGLRLAGPALPYAGGELASQAVLPGAIQVPPGGQPIIVGWDGPVTGGYPVIAGVIAVDLPRLAQLRPGDKVAFRFVGLDEARAAAQQAKEIIAGAAR